MSELIAITLPKWGLEMSEGTVTTWHAAEGEACDKGIELVDIETDKIVNSLELDQAGTLQRIVVGEGETVAVGTLIAVMSEADASKADVDKFIADYQPVDASFEPGDGAGKDDPAGASAASDEPKSTPLAKRVAASEGVDLAAVQGSGRKGKITKGDVERQSAAAPTAKSPEEIAADNAKVHASPIALKVANEFSIPLAHIEGTGRKGRVSLDDVRKLADRSGIQVPRAQFSRTEMRSDGTAQPGAEQPFAGMRKTIAKALVHAKQTVPHFYSTVDVEVDALLAARSDLNAGAEEGAPKISVNDFILRAAALALKQHPSVNVHVTDNGIIPFAQTDIAIAVGLEGGLITPVLRDVANAGIRDIANSSAELVQRARDRKLVASELEGGTFTVSNLGMFGVREFDAIIHPPQAAVIAIGGTRREAREGENGSVEFASVMSATLSADHRAIDGMLAAQFLGTFKQLMERPAQLIVQAG